MIFLIRNTKPWLYLVKMGCPGGWILSILWILNMGFPVWNSGSAHQSSQVYKWVQYRIMHGLLRTIIRRRHIVSEICQVIFVGVSTANNFSYEKWIFCVNKELTIQVNQNLWRSHNFLRFMMNCRLLLNILKLIWSIRVIIKPSGYRRLWRYGG